MKLRGLRGQAALLTGANVLTRALGFVLRVLMSRWLGAQVMGIAELASGMHMLCITPVTAGLPMAVSRLTAKAPPERREQALCAARSLVRRTSLALMPAVLLLSPLIARLLGDERTLPSLLMFTPCILILGLSGVYNGYCYGTGNALPPALSELTEQILRFTVILALLRLLPGLSAAWLAAVPAFATMAAEAGGLLLVCAMLRARGVRRAAYPPALRERLVRLAAPMTLMRLTTTLMRSVNAVLIPLRLTASGLPAAEATARLGMLNGMVMPVLFLPGMLTGALSVLGAPAVARMEGDGRALRRMTARLLLPTAAVCLMAMPALWAAAPFLSARVYRLPELTPLFRLMTPALLLTGLQQVVSGLLAGLGHQRKALYALLAGAAVTLAGNWFLTALPALRLAGAGVAMMLGQAVTLLLGVCVLARAVRR